MVKRSSIAALHRCCRGIVLLFGVLLFVQSVEGKESQHLRFFHANRSFLLRAFERLPRSQDPVEDTSRNWNFDPFAEWSATEAVQAVQTQLDSAHTLEALDQYHSALDSLQARVEYAAQRLDDLDYRFATHLRTSLEVTLETHSNTRLQRVEAWLNGEQASVHVLNDDEREALQSGGILEVLRTPVEPRAQELRIIAYVQGRDDPLRFQEEVHPATDRLLRMHIDLEKNKARFKPTILQGGD